MTTRSGDRPMPHWRDFTPVNYLGVINGGYTFRVVVATDGDPAPIRRSPTASPGARLPGGGRT